MRVLFVSHVRSKYGAGRSLLALIDGLSEKGVTSCVVLPSKGPLVAELVQRGVEYTVVPLKLWASPDGWVGKRILRGCFNLLVSMRIAIKVRSWEADVVYTNSSVTPVGAFAALLSGKPHVWHIREFGEEDYGLSFDLGFRRTARLIERLSSQVIVISEALKSKYAQHICSKNLKVVYNPVSVEAEARFLLGDTESVAGASSNEIPIATIVGMIHPGKGQMDAILAVTELLRQGIRLKLKIVGDGEANYLNRLKHVVAENDIGQYVEFMGFVDEPLKIMRTADMVLVCSRSEAFGRVTIESMFTGTPVIGTRSGATSELIKEGVNGLLYESGDYKGLAERIQYLIEHPEEAEQMGRNGFEWSSERFTVERYTDEVLDVLYTVVLSEQEEKKCVVQR
jgi:glycosyltransferase involved in cell wall biosynthesis